MNKRVIFIILGIIILAGIFYAYYEVSNESQLSPKSRGSAKSVSLDKIAAGQGTDNFFIIGRFTRGNTDFSEISSGSRVTDTNILNKFTMKGG